MVYNIKIFDIVCMYHIDLTLTLVTLALGVGVGVVEIKLPPSYIYIYIYVCMYVCAYTYSVCAFELAVEKLIVTKYVIRMHTYVCTQMHLNICTRMPMPTSVIYTLLRKYIYNIFNICKQERVLRHYTTLFLL